ncbi:glycosyltransferase family 4 protein [Exiguobacterium sp. s56]|uniref:glycosyltransferase family 4 protein n=1 Tax=Exiguobacterium sp. s56 TaxID=2751232 RepID=UPI001BE6E6A0|nr:glycosyltransferase family 4 protein [Exiguobacterium sp. s56]
MRIFYVGDFYSNTGPANVNKVIQKYNQDNDLFSVKKNIFMRFFELILKIFISDAVIFSGISRLNLIGIALSKLFGKKTGYLMHGSCKFESEINRSNNKKIEKIEVEILEKIDVIICVSKLFKNWTKNEYPKYSNKIEYVNNAIDVEKISLKQIQNVTGRNDKMLMSTGGGAPIKNIKSLCKAIDSLNKEDFLNLRLLVLGNDGDDSNEIKSYDFVEFIPTVPSEKMNFYYQKANLYIQNSDFETFGLAPLEALLNGCNLLVSQNIGMLEVFDAYENSDIIFNSYNHREIAEKIKSILIDSNNERLLNNVDWQCIDPEKLSQRFKKIMSNSKG